jgi:GT2 family glycosyltransferase
VLAFCDSDCLPEPRWLEQGLAALECADVVAGEVTFAAPEPPTVWSLLTIDMFLDQKRNVALSRGVTANLLVRRELFDRLGGFDASLPSGGDYDFVGRAVTSGARLAYARDAVVRHPTLDSRRVFLRKVWTTNRWRAVRMARARKRPGLKSVVGLVPGLGVAFARREALRPIWRLEESRLRAAGVSIGWRVHLGAMSLIYFVVAAVGGCAQVRGWLEGRSMRDAFDGAGVAERQAPGQLGDAP